MLTKNKREEVEQVKGKKTVDAIITCWLLWHAVEIKKLKTEVSSLTHTSLRTQVKV